MGKVAFEIFIHGRVVRRKVGGYDVHGVVRWTLVQIVVEGSWLLGRQWCVVPCSADGVALLVDNDLREGVLSDQQSELCQLLELRSKETKESDFAVARPEGPAPMIAMRFVS